jgi:hypothetical protein
MLDSKASLLGLADPASAITSKNKVILVITAVAKQM